MPAQRVTHRQVLSFLWSSLRKYRLYLAVMMVMLLLSTALQLAQPFFYKSVLDAIVEGVPGDRAVFRQALKLVLFAVLCGVGHLTLHESASRILGWIETRVMERIHADAFAHVQRLSTDYHVNEFAGATARKIGRGTDAIETMIDRLWFNFLPLLALTAGFFVVLGIFAPLIGLAIVGSIIVYVPISVSLNIILARYHAWTDRQDTRVTGSMVDAISGNAAVKAFGAEQREDARHGKVVRLWRDRLYKTWGMGVLITWVQFMLLMLIEFALLVTAIYLWFQGEFTAGGFLVVTFYLMQLWGRLFDIGQQFRNYLQASAHVEELVGLMHTPLGVSDVAEADQLSVRRGEIQFENVRFHYDKASKAVFQDFSLTVAAGERVALVGHSGGGKSTIVKLLLRLYDLNQGRILIDGQDIAKVTQKSLRRSVALVPQDPILFHRSIAENIAYAKPGATSVDIERVAKLAHAHEFIERLPKKYDTLVGERGVKLSGGERQRIAIARAMLADTPVLILDEATSSLDSLSEGFIQEALARLIQGRTTIVIAHRLSTIKRVDRILVIEVGKIVEEGSHAALLKKKDGLYRNFYELQAGGFIGE